MVPSPRKQRYKDKLIHAKRRMTNIDNWINDSDEMAKLATYKAVQELIEVLTDTIGMMIKDMDLNPRDDYSNFKKLQKTGIIDEEQKEQLNEANGLRNRLIHSYNGIDDERAISSFKRLYPGIKEVLKVIENWIESTQKIS